MTRVCIGIVCIGQTYNREFAKVFKPSVDAYARKYGYDVRVFTEFLSSDTHPDCISFQKCLVPMQLLDYDCVVVLDADIYIHDYAPPIHTLLTDKIGIVDEVQQVNPDQYKALGFASDPTDYYRLAGFGLQTSHILNTGMMLCNPKLHAEYLQDIYTEYIGEAPGHSRRFHYEQGCIGYELQVDNAFALLQNQWNYIYMFNKYLKIPFARPFFLHFAGIGSRATELEHYLAVQRVQSTRRWGIKK